jgi:hypothetical protein
VPCRAAKEGTESVGGKHGWEGQAGPEEDIRERREMKLGTLQEIYHINHFGAN